MTKKQMKQIVFFTVVGSLAIMGIFSGFMVALLHGLQGDWGFMCVYVGICTFGFFMLKPFVKQAYTLIKNKEGVS